MTRRLALVFGGSRGIGAAVVAALSREGCDVAATYATAAPDLPGAATILTAHACDIRDAESVARACDAAEGAHGRRPDIVVASAGINLPPAPVAEFPADRFRELVETNIVGGFNMLHEAARRVRDGGAIIGITTSMVRVGIPGGGPYTASKAAMESLLRSMARELAGRGVRVNGVAPGPVDTDLFRAGKDAAALERSAGLSPFGRIGRPEEVAEVVAFLASDRASWVHGQIVQPNGGMV